MPYKGAERFSTIFSSAEGAKIRAYMRRKRKTMYALLKEAIRFYMQKHP